jgi:branched-chain amino acid aminotransferase
MSGAWCYVNGQYVRAEHAHISVFDLGLLRGHGVFDLLRTYQGRPFQMQDHLERLRRSAERASVELPLSLPEIASVIESLLQRNGFAETTVKIVATGGRSSDHLLPQGPGSLIVLASPLTPFPERLYREGVRLSTTTQARSLPEAKTLQYLPAILALREGQMRGAQEALYVNARGELLEATTSNFFACVGGQWVTPPEGEILAGVTRATLLRLTEISVRPLHKEEELEEAFITSTTREIMPVSAIDERPIPLGERTRQLQALFRRHALRGDK